jgi:hypothetical protein
MVKPKFKWNYRPLITLAIASLVVLGMHVRWVCIEIKSGTANWEVYRNGIVAPWMDSPSIDDVFRITGANEVRRRERSYFGLTSKEGRTSIFVPGN